MKEANLAHVAGFDARFVCEGADDVALACAVSLAYFETKGFHVDAVGFESCGSFVPPFPFVPFFASASRSFLQVEGFAACLKVGEGGGEGDRVGFLLFSEIFIEHFAVFRKVELKGFFETDEKALGLAFVEFRDGWEFVGFELALHRSLYRLQDSDLLACHEEDGVSRATCPTRAAGPVDVGLDVEGGVVVQHVADAVHVQSAGGHVGGHEYVELAFPQATDGFFTEKLGHVAV